MNIPITPMHTEEILDRQDELLQTERDLLNEIDELADTLKEKYLRLEELRFEKKQLNDQLYTILELKKKARKRVTFSVRNLVTEDETVDNFDITLDGKQFKIGTTEKCQVRLTSPGLEGVHAMIQVEEDGSLTAYDFGREPSTLINTDSLVKATIKVSDTLTIGPVVMMIMEITEVPSLSNREKNLGRPPYPHPLTERRPIPKNIPRKYQHSLIKN